MAKIVVNIDMDAITSASSSVDDDYDERLCRPCHHD